MTSLPPHILVVRGSFSLNRREYQKKLFTPAEKMSRLRVNKLTNKDNNGAPEFVHGVTVSGVATATKFKMKPN